MKKKAPNYYNKDELKEFEVLINQKLTEAGEEYAHLAESLKERDGSTDNYNDFGTTDGREKEQVEMLMARQKKFMVNP